MLMMAFNEFLSWYVILICGCAIAVGGIKGNRASVSTSRPPKNRNARAADRLQCWRPLKNLECKDEPDNAFTRAGNLFRNSHGRRHQAWRRRGHQFVEGGHPRQDLRRSAEAEGQGRRKGKIGRAHV